MSRTYVAQWIAGDVDSEAIYDFIDAWHAGEGSEVSLAAFLGFTGDEYAAWVERPRVLPAILASKRSGVPLEDALAEFSRAS